MADTFSCPECSVKLRRSPALQPGARVQCPKCSLQFSVPELGPEDDDSPPPRQDGPRQSLRPSTAAINHRGEIERDPPSRNLRQTDDFAPRGRDRFDEDDYDKPPRRTVGGPDDLPTNYKIEIGDWFGLGFKHWGAMLGPFLGYAALMCLIVPLLCILFPLAPFVLPHLAAGPIVVAVKMLRGDDWSFGDFFGGFKWYGQILGVNFLLGLIFFACMLPVLLAYALLLIAISQGGRGGPHPAIVLIFIPAILLSTVALYFFSIRFYHALPLIIDRNFGAIDALKGSWKLTKGHFWMTFVVFLLIGMINSAGISLCYIGVFFSAPLAILVQMAGYMLIAGSRPPVSPDSMPPRRRVARDEY